jgi:hypothetical protein
LLTEKSLGIPAIRALSLISNATQHPGFGGFWPLSKAPLCQADLFHIDENSRLESRAAHFQKTLSGGESAPGG